ncbi:myb-like protein Q [Anopheles darlingi]|uniref:myb-like protein Q n=1 Tax=Anopheles darlingi TaxID=43151 RepID=UPI002100092E|nr:myb-like protein Q [Anopheles darlingi]XP_049541038.1 myb-like protein Q [Anopheles darlingi]
MAGKLSRQLALVAIVLALGAPWCSWAFQSNDDAGNDYARQQRHHQQQQQQHQRKQLPHHQHHSHHHLHQHQHQQQQQQLDRRNQTSLNQQQQQQQPSASYSLISGPAVVNRGSDYGGVRGRPAFEQPQLLYPHQQQHHHHQQQSPRVHQQDTPPQHHHQHHHHRRHHGRGGQHGQGRSATGDWRRTTPVADTAAATGGDAVRPVTRMLTRSGGTTFGGNRGQNNTSKNICTVYAYRKSLVRTHYPAQPCTDPTNCASSSHRTYSYPMIKREVCCRGWETTTTVADGCFKPVCRTACRNGGQCVAPDRCSCPKGFTGTHCEQDVNECREFKPCDQTCYNTEGSYYCTCRDGFMLQSDRQTCRKIDETNDIATEARDMENDVDYDSLDTRITKLEQMLSREERRTFNEKQELAKKVQYTMEAVSVLKSQVARLAQRMYPSPEYGKRTAH